MLPAIQHNSSDSDAFSNTNLPPAQLQALALLAQGRSVTAAARHAGVHRTTIHHWMRHEPAFRNAVRKARLEYVATLADDLRDLAGLALETLHGLLNDPSTPALVRLKAALAVLERPHLPEQDWRLPERLDATPGHRPRAAHEGQRKLSAPDLLQS